LAFCQQGCCNNVLERATLHILHYDPEFILVNESVDIIHDICICEARITRIPFMIKNFPGCESMCICLIATERVDLKLVGSKRTTRGTT
jgi:hypothetical protein